MYLAGRDAATARNAACSPPPPNERPTGLIVTLGNPRTEDPNRIIDDLLGGLHRPGKALVQIDRARAIEAALADARPGDVVLIAGKGRHTFQILADRIVHFDDAAIARNWLRSRGATPKFRVNRSTHGHRYCKGAACDITRAAPLFY